MNEVFLKPADGLRVPDPVTNEPLPPAGGFKPLDQYWQRRIRDGSVTRAPAPKPAPARPAAKKED